MNEDLLHRVRNAVPTAAVSAPDSVVAPADAESTLELVRLCAETGTPFAVRSTAAGSSAAAPSDGLLLSLERLASVDVHASALTVRAGAGAPVTSLQRRVAAEGLVISGMPGGSLPASVGALVARGAVPRRALTGVEAVLANGDPIAFGGVLKDVVGYDVPALLLGSMGRLAVIVAVTFRLEPAAARTVTPAAPQGAVPLDPALVRAFDPLELLRASA